MTPEFMADWVAAAPDAPTRELRMAVHTILAAVSRAPRLPNHMVLKGGIPLALEYQGDRFTRDIDFSTAKTVPDMAVEGVVEELAISGALGPTVRSHRTSIRRPNGDDLAYVSISSKGLAAASCRAIWIAPS